MNIRLLKSQDTQVLEEYLAPHKAECMFICSNLKATGIEYGGSDFEGEYFGCFDINDQLQGVIVHYWNGNVMMHSEDHDVLEKLILHLKNNISRPIAGILGPNIQAEHVIKKLGLSGLSFGINSNEGLYEINLEALNNLNMQSNMKVVPAQDVPKSILTLWMKSYDIEALGALDDEALEKQVQEHWNLRLQKNDSWVLLLDGTPVALSAFNARLIDMVQVGPVWTPPEYRNKGFARLLLAYTLHQEKLKGTKQAILFTDNPAAIKAYLAIGFKKIGNYRLALLEQPVQLQEIEFTKSPMAIDIDIPIHSKNIQD
jgi:GNAT superfamily N-acetyltransferase